MYSFLINTLFSNEMTGSDLLFGSFAKNIKDIEIPGYPHSSSLSFYCDSFKVFLAQPCLQTCLQSVPLIASIETSPDSSSTFSGVFPYLTKKDLEAQRDGLVHPGSHSTRGRGKI